MQEKQFTESLAVVKTVRRCFIPKAMMPWVIFAISGSFVVYQFCLSLSSGVMVSALMNSFSLTAFGASVLVSSFYYIYVILQTPAGILMDRFGPRRLLVLGSLVCALGSYVFASAQGFVGADLGRLMMGGGSAFAFVGALYLLNQWFPVRLYAFLIGIMESSIMLMAIVSDMALVRAMGTTGWRSMMMLSAFIALGFTVLLFLFVRDRPEGNDETEESVRKLVFWNSLSLVLRHPILWLNGFYSGMLFSVVTVFVSLWGIPYMATELNVTEIQATRLGAYVLIGIAVGCPFWGWLYGRIRKKRRLLIGSALVTALMMTLILFCEFLPRPVLLMVLFTMGFFSCVYLLSFAITQQLVDRKMRGTAAGFTNTLSVGAGPVLQLLIGGLLDLSYSWHTQSSNYTATDYHIALSVLPVGLLLAAIAAYYLKGIDD